MRFLAEHSGLFLKFWDLYNVMVEEFELCRQTRHLPEKMFCQSFNRRIREDGRQSGFRMPSTGCSRRSVGWVYLRQLLRLSTASPISLQTIEAAAAGT